MWMFTLNNKEVLLPLVEERFFSEKAVFGLSFLRYKVFIAFPRLTSKKEIILKVMKKCLDGVCLDREEKVKLSCHTRFKDFYSTDYTEHMEPYLERWKKLDLQFKGIHTGSSVLPGRFK